MPSAPPSSLIVVGNSQAGASQTFTICCSFSFRSCLPVPSIPVDVAYPEMQKTAFFFSDVLMDYMLSLVVPRGHASWFTCNFYCWVWTCDKTIVIQCRRKERKGGLGLGLCFLMLYFVFCLNFK